MKELSMTPTEVRRKRNTEDEVDEDVLALRSHFGRLGEVLPVGDADEPILAPSVRTALFEWLSEIRSREALEAAGLKPRNTALFYGPPGCGKTTMAHHLAARLGLPMLLVGPENIISSGWGEAETALARLFDKLKTAPVPFVAFIDEAEGIGGSRDKNTGGRADNARTNLMGVLLRKLESYDGFLVAATNRAEDIDQALWRRFHLQVSIALPGADERFAILRRCGLPFEFTDDDIELLTDLTAGASPALLRGLMEGVKRTLIMGPKIGLDITDAPKVFRRVVGSVAPPPEIERPPLWISQAKTAGMAWPPMNKGAL